MKRDITSHFIERLKPIQAPRAAVVRPSVVGLRIGGTAVIALSAADAVLAVRGLKSVLR
jgi:hypothetical protein